ncbi:MAG: cell division protein ZapB [Thermodesulfobacteriota bacterium]|nr:cell division protein ZapB [Thermodesulfobacteriota bacterium]
MIIKELFLEPLDILEDKITGLLKTVGMIKKENEELKAKIREKEEEAEGIRQEMNDLLREKEDVKTRVAGLIDRMGEC